MTVQATEERLQHPDMTQMMDRESYLEESVTGKMTATSAGAGEILNTCTITNRGQVALTEDFMKQQQNTHSSQIHMEHS